MVTLYGITNCDTMRKARKWLDGHGVAYAFHDYKKLGLEETTLRGWVEELGWETLLNRRGTSWRKLGEEVKASIDREGAVKLMLATPAMIKRPVLDTGTACFVGFQPSAYERIFL